MHIKENREAKLKIVLKYRIIFYSRFVNGGGGGGEDESV